MRDQYTDEVFTNAEQVYWLPTYLSREDDREVLTPEKLTTRLAREIHITTMGDTLWQAIEQARTENKLVLLMGAGSIDGWAREQLRV